MVQDLFVVLKSGSDADDDDPVAPVGERSDILGEYLDRLGGRQLVRGRLGVELLGLA
ncbi:hypothetical protein AB0911_37110 [Streptomyces nigra]|uniref:hypothetical protein n=1 Tax=Streptomyces nigra TaxID=1827580 RepID=UPI003453F6A0